MVAAKVDRQGRIVIPQPERERLSLVAGDEIELVRTAEGLALEPRRRAVLSRRSGGLLVATIEGQGEISNASVLSALHAHRDGLEP